MGKKLKNNVPELRFKEFKEKLLNTTFKKVVLSNQYGPRFNANDYDIDGNIKTIRGTDISLDGEIKYSQVPIAKLDFDFIKNHILKDGDLVMITTADCGLTGVFRKQYFDYIPSAYAVKITLNEMGNPEYFKYFFQTNHAKNEVKSFIRKATVANLPCSDILRIKLHLPNIQEQTKIADFLITIDEKIAELRRKQELLQTYKRGVMQKIFSQEIRFKGAIGSEFPDWKATNLGEIAKIKRGASPRPISSSKWFSVKSNIGWVRISDVTKSDKYLDKTEQYLSDSGIEKSKFVSSENLIMSICATIGKPIITKIDVCIHDGFVVFENLKTDILFTYFFLKRIEYGWKKYGQPGIQLNLNTDIVSNESIYLPSLEEQEKIADLLTAIDQKIETLSRQIDQTEQFKKGLLQKLFV